MGYMAYYMLVVGDEGEHSFPQARHEEVLDWLERDDIFRHELEDFHEQGMSGYTTWYEHDRDMIRLSKVFPEILFVLWGEGEEPEDLWKCYYLGGRMQEAPARVEYPPFDPEELIDPKAAVD